MASAPSFDDFENSLNNLPDELKRNLALMLSIDSKCQKLNADADKMAKDYFSNFRNYSARKRKEIKASIESKYDEAKELCDDKVQISVQNYALVDKRIRNLDTEISKLEKRVQLKADMHEEALKAKINLPPKKGGSKIKSAPSTASAVAGPSGASVSHGIAHSDMPIDPNEPTFCLCKQVSFGEMIGCDNPDCGIEWFHFECVSLITKPKGKWFCPTCIKDKKKK